MTPRKLYAEIRRKNPGRPIGPHWESHGAYLGDDVWGDPDYFGLPGEAECVLLPTEDEVEELRKRRGKSR